MGDQRFLCRTCGEWHEGTPDLAFAAPDYYAGLDEAGKKKAKLSSDVCIIDKDYFVRGVIEIPVLGQGQSFGWGAWVSLSERNFRRYVELFEADRGSGEGPYFGWLSNRFPWYPETIGLKTNLHLRPYPARPYIELEATEHPLAVHQRQGVDREVLQAIIEANAHGVQ
jgi:hypothetical protein